MNELQVFNYKGQDVRTVQIEGEPWWVLADVCQVLGISNPRRVAARLDDDEKNTIHLADSIRGNLNNTVTQSYGIQGNLNNTVHLVDGIRGNPNVTVVNEPGLYSVILRSDKPEAKAFKRWITHEVLPAIRQTGHYGTTEPSAEAGLQRIGLIIRAAEHKAVPQSEQLRLLKLAVRDLTGTELTTQKTQILSIMDLPEVYGVVKKGKVKKFGHGKGSVQLYSLLELADELGISPSEFNDFADSHNLKSSYMGEWVRVETAQGEAREFIYVHSVIDGYFEEVR